jgi:hypothetical protein
MHCVVIIRQPDPSKVREKASCFSIPLGVVNNFLKALPSKAFKKLFTLGFVQTLKIEMTKVKSDYLAQYQLHP